MIEKHEYKNALIRIFLTQVFLLLIISTLLIVQIVLSLQERSLLKSIDENIRDTYFVLKGWK